MTKLILVRHGQSEANLSHRFAGHFDCDLTKLGHLQAEKVADFLTANYKIDKIYSSDLLRAYNTAVPTAKKLNLDIEKDTALREIRAGLWEGMLFEEIATKYANEFSVWLSEIANAVCNDGESVKSLYNRISNEIAKICEQNDGKTVLITTHATPIKAFQAFVQSGNVAFMNEIDWVPNCSTTVCNYENGKFSFELIGFNDYLDELKSHFPKGAV